MKVETLQQVPVSLVTVRQANITQLKQLNLALFPVRYQEKFYTEAISSGHFTKLAYYGDLCVGCLACRLEKEEGSRDVKLYIMTLGVLAPYRRIGIGSKLLRMTMEQCAEDSTIAEVYLHVQTNNDVAIEFYRKFDFEVICTIQNYYKRIQPPDCYVLSKKVVSAGAPAK